MIKKRIVGIPVHTQCILKYMGYILPTQFNVPSIYIRIYHYAILCTIVAYAILTAYDITKVALYGIRAYILLLLSACTIVFTQMYKIEINKRKSKKNQAHKKNRKHIYKGKDIIFETKMYKLPLKIEGIFIALSVVFGFGVIIPIPESIYICKIIFHVILIFIAILNGVILCIENIAEFYQAKDFYKK